jgi:hypothetical protein
MNASFKTRSKVTLPSQYSALGIMHRLPRWHKFEIFLDDRPNTNVGTPDPAGPERYQTPLFAVYENFYSDIDRAW